MKENKQDFKALAKKETTGAGNRKN